MVQSLPRSDSFRILFNSPELSEVQRSGFHLFLKKGIAEELSKISCIPIKNVHFLVEIIVDAPNFRLVAPENNYRDCILKMKSYTCKLYVKTKILFKDKISGELLHQTQPEWVFLADLPMMTKRGHFVINGSPRIVVHQVGRAPGVYFKKVLKVKDDIHNKARFYGDIIPRKGVWVRLQINKKGEIDLKLKKSKKVRAEMVEKCLELLEKEAEIKRSFVVGANQNKAFVRTTTFLRTYVPKREVLVENQNRVGALRCKNEVFAQQSFCTTSFLHSTVPKQSFGSTSFWYKPSLNKTSFSYGTVRYLKTKFWLNQAFARTKFVQKQNLSKANKITLFTGNKKAGLDLAVPEYFSKFIQAKTKQYQEQVAVKSQTSFNGAVPKLSFSKISSSVFAKASLIHKNGVMQNGYQAKNVKRFFQVKETELCSTKKQALLRNIFYFKAVKGEIITETKQNENSFRFALLPFGNQKINTDTNRSVHTLACTRFFNSFNKNINSNRFQSCLGKTLPCANKNSVFVRTTKFLQPFDSNSCVRQNHVQSFIIERTAKADFSALYKAEKSAFANVYTSFYKNEIQDIEERVSVPLEKLPQDITKTSSLNSNLFSATKLPKKVKNQLSPKRKLAKAKYLSSVIEPFIAQTLFKQSQARTKQYQNQIAVSRVLQTKTPFKPKPSINQNRVEPKLCFGSTSFLQNLEKHAFTNKKKVVKKASLSSNLKKIREYIYQLFKKSDLYDLGFVGREKINTKFGISVKETQLTALDIKKSINWLSKLRAGKEEIDDIDHSQNRRVRTSSELIQTQFSIGITRLKNGVTKRVLSPSVTKRNKTEFFSSFVLPINGKANQNSVKIKTPFKLKPSLNQNRVEPKLSLNKTSFCYGTVRPQYANKNGVFVKSGLNLVYYAQSFFFNRVPSKPLYSNTLFWQKNSNMGVSGEKQSLNQNQVIPKRSFGTVRYNFVFSKRPFLQNKDVKKQKSYNHAVFSHRVFVNMPLITFYLAIVFARSSFGLQIVKSLAVANKNKVFVQRSLNQNQVEPKLGFGTVLCKNEVFVPTKFLHNVKIKSNRNQLPFKGKSSCLIKQDFILDLDKQSLTGETQYPKVSFLQKKDFGNGFITSGDKKQSKYSLGKRITFTCKNPYWIPSKQKKFSYSSERKATGLNLQSLLSTLSATNWMEKNLVIKREYQSITNKNVQKKSVIFPFINSERNAALAPSNRLVSNFSASEWFSTKPINGALREFFSSSPLSQYMDQTNPLAEVTHKRRISSLGIGGVSRESAGMTIRGIHPTHYGRICPIETPEGKNAGLVNSLAFYAKVNHQGFIETPYYQVIKGQIQHELGFSFYSAGKESRNGLSIAPNDIKQSKSKLLASNISSVESIPVRITDNLLDLFKKKRPSQVDCIGISPVQILSVATSLIPFLEHNDANRALMGSNMQRQAVSLMRSERPLVGTGLEARVLAESGHLVQSKVSGFISHVSAHQVVVERLLTNLSTLCIANKNKVFVTQTKIKLTRTKTKFLLRKQKQSLNKTSFCYGTSTLQYARDKKTPFSSNFVTLSYPLMKKKVALSPVMHSISTFSRSNQETCLTQKPLVEEGDWVQRGDMLSDCSAGQKGELSVGKNMFIAYIPWQGYNFEDAIVISDRLVKEQLYTSLHIERYTVTVNDLKEKMVDTNEWFTGKLPGVDSKKRVHLQKSGLPKIGSILREGDILVGKIKYSKKKAATPYDKLVCDILGEHNFSVQNTSLYVPKGVHEARILTYKIKKRFDKALKSGVNNTNMLTGGTNLRPAGAPKVIHLFLGEKRNIQVGDKMSGRHGNKGIVSTILPKQDMPYLADGSPIDILLNPLGVPSRMNVGQVFECLLGLASTYLHQNFKVTAFDELYGVEASQSLVFLKLYQARLQSGQNWLFQVNFPGKTRLTDGRTGECLDQWVTVGRAYMLKLIHMVNEKIHARAIGPYALVTQQPLKGRAHKGGQRLGEMEVWAVEGFGAAYILQELLTKKSDDSIGRKEVLKAMLPKSASFLDFIDPFGQPHTVTTHSKEESKLHSEESASSGQESFTVLGQPDIFKVLICELQALCLDVGVYSIKTESFQRQFMGIFE